ncbi:MAG TPA: MopE-related protein [Candidatus Polarisedimenticolaceae bacterium]|nr:MopE-related protein [Candidatus Polarisedimenticolaceae bacterium]
MRPRTLSWTLLLCAGVATAASAAPCPDADGDGYAVCSGGCTLAAGDQCGDCDDSRASVRPGRAESCFNFRDDDCDGATDLLDPECQAGSCRDGDGDGFALCTGGCSLSNGDVCGDCDDQRGDVHPGVAEICTNGRDDDCDGASDGQEPACACPDGDGDGWAVCSGSCSPAPGDTCGDCDDQRADTLANRPDADGDAVPDCADNCQETSNPGQADFDGDGMGDACETGVRLCDVDHSGRVDGFDLAIVARAFGRSCGQTGYDPDADLTRDCGIDGEDLAVLAAEFGHSWR